MCQHFFYILESKLVDLKTKIEKNTSELKYYCGFICQHNKKTFLL